MQYQKGYKYQNYRYESIHTDFRPVYDIVSTGGFITITKNGLMTCKKGYAWDGASWSIDTDTNIRASMFHDAGYQLIREGLLKLSDKKYLDQKMREICIEDGMMRFRAWYFFRGVTVFGESSAIPGNTRKVYTAP